MTKRLIHSRTGRWWQRSLLVAGLFLLCLLLVPLAGAAPASGTPPPNEDSPTEVYLSFLLLDIPEIDVQSESYQVEGLLYAGWYDERTAFSPAILVEPEEEESGQAAPEDTGASLDEGRHLAAGDMRSQIEPSFVMGGVKSYSGDAALSVIEEQIWSPQFEIINSRGEPFRNLYTSVRVYEDGFVEYEERFNGLLAGPMDLRKFPFDSQVLPLRITTFDYDSRQVVFKQIQTDASPDFRLAEWTVNQISGTTKTDTAYGIEPQDEETAFYYPVAELAINISRKSGYYVLRVILPLALIIAVSWSVFWLESGSVSDQLAVSFTVLLTIVAFNFLVADKLPPIAYTTFMDALLLMSYVFLALSIVQNIMQASLFSAGKEEASRMIDVTARWLFPLAYVAVAGLATLYFFVWAA